MIFKSSLKNLERTNMVREKLDWLNFNKCRYCGWKLSYKSNSERIICRHCGRINYKNSKVKFQNKLKRKILEEKRKKQD